MFRKKDFGRGLRLIRNLKGLTLTDLYEKSGISITNLSKLERNRKELDDDDEMHSIAQALGVELELFKNIEYIGALKGDEIIEALYKEAVLLKSKTIMHTFKDLHQSIYDEIQKNIFKLTSQLKVKKNTFQGGG